VTELSELPSRPLSTLNSKLSTPVSHPSGKKSQAVFPLGSGIPGVSGDANVYAPATPGFITGSFAKLPGLVPAAVVEGFDPSGGRENVVSFIACLRRTKVTEMLNHSPLSLIQYHE